jgi:hypothetical protein
MEDIVVTEVDHKRGMHTDRIGQEVPGGYTTSGWSIWHVLVFDLYQRELTYLNQTSHTYK